MRILDRYILKSILSIFLGSLFAFFFLYIIIDLFSHLDTILAQKVTIAVLVKYYSSFLPVIFSQVSPISCLLATLYTFATLNRDNEIIAMRASGLSIFQITHTIIILGFILSIFILLISDTIIPQSLMTTQKIKQEMESSRKQSKNKGPEIIKNLSLYGSNNRLFFINEFNTTDNSIDGITILEDNDQQHNTKKIIADRAVYKDGIWRFYNSKTFNFDEKSQIIGDAQYSEEEIMQISETPKDFLNQKQLPEYMSINQLEQYIWKLSKTGAKTVVRNFQIEHYNRLASPFTSIVIILLGIPFALKVKKRAAGLSSLGLVFMLVFFYYILNGVCLALGKSGFIPPALSAVLSHSIVLFFSFYMLSKIP